MNPTHFDDAGFSALLEKDGRRRAEEAAATGLDEVAGLLLPLALSLSRLAARMAVAEAAQ